MKHFLFFTFLICTLFSCTNGIEQSEKTSLQERNEKENHLDSLLRADKKIQEDSLQAPFNFNKGSEFLMLIPNAKSKDEANEHLKKAVYYYQKGVELGTNDLNAVFYCGILTDKKGEKEKAKSYYLKTIALAKKNLLNIDKIIQPTNSENIVQLTEKQLKIAKTNYSVLQQFYSALSELMLGKTALANAKIESLKKAYPDFPFSSIAIGGFSSRTEILDWVYVENGDY